MKLKVQQLAEILVACGLVDERALLDPERFDGCATVGKIAEATVRVEAALAAAEEARP